MNNIHIDVLGQPPTQNEIENCKNRICREIKWYTLYSYSSIIGCYSFICVLIWWVLYHNVPTDQVHAWSAVFLMIIPLLGYFVSKKCINTLVCLSEDRQLLVPFDMNKSPERADDLMQILENDDVKEYLRKVGQLDRQPLQLEIKTLMQWVQQAPQRETLSRAKQQLALAINAQ